ncbi:MAG TPA: TrkA family potassium uptake protein [Chitinophagales bacterium]|mgnify:CR=1 FL=1|nr:TrkA family potassium uptake protein [Chitinophagales bacterium]HRK25867.1 TrkA family potassium uptake protein [Chitinophagales bacterium]
MKFIIIGLGNFGAALALKMTEMGHEVIGVDNSMTKVSLLRDAITHTVCLDSTDIQAVRTLPLKETDVAIVAIGEDVGASIMATAVLKQLNVKKVIGRAISPLHQTVLEAMGITHIIHPEAETAERLAKRLDIKGIIDSFNLTDRYNIIEATVPERYVGQSIRDVNFRNKYNVVILTIIRVTEQKNVLGVTHKVSEVVGVAAPDMIFEKDDILVLFGNIKDIQRLLTQA